MISITCTQCQTVLTIDDAFAGGVCRCQHCGTIQTVPSARKANATPQPFASPSSTQSKTLYQNEAAARTTGANIATTGARSSSGLDDLAHAVGASGSGLNRSGLRGAYVGPATPSAAVEVVAPPAAAPVAYAAPKTRAVASKKAPLVPILIGAGAVIVLLLGVIVYLFMGKSSSNGIGPSGTDGGSSSTGGGTFFGTSIAGSHVIYLLDNANSIRNDFDPVWAATLQSIVSLGADKKFAVILWNNNEVQFAYPKDGLAAAASMPIEELRGQFQDIQAMGMSNLRPSLERAMSRNPDAVVIVTAKTSLDSDDISALEGAKSNSAGKVKFYAFTVGDGGDNSVLKLTASASGGEYRHLSSQELRAGPP